eukprot:8778694-Prorocentrum_lima.AAC.1
MSVLAKFPHMPFEGGAGLEQAKTGMLQWASAGGGTSPEPALPALLACSHPRLGLGRQTGRG